MRLEVLVGSSDPIIYPIKQSKILVGSAESCDVIISGTGVSRKHLMISVDGDNYYVVDQGSTNGSFMNEERLIPGRRVEFTSFFPVRLGDDVLISLLSDDEESGFLEGNRIITTRESTSPGIKRPQSLDDGKTRTIKLSDIKANQTEKLIKSRQVKRAAVKPKPPVKKDSGNKFVPFLAVLLVAGAIVYHFNYKEPEVVPPPPIQPGRIVKPKEVQPTPSFLMNESDMTSKESLGSLIRDIKCVTDLEKYLCEKVSGAQGGIWGTTQSGTMLNVMVDGSVYFKEAETLLDEVVKLSRGSIVKDDEFLTLLSSVLFLNQAIPDDLDYEKLKASKLTFALYTGSENPEVKVSIAILPEALKLYKARPKEDYKKTLRYTGIKGLEFTQKLYRKY